MATRQLIEGPCILEFHYGPTGEKRRAMIGPGMVVSVLEPDPPAAQDEGPKVHSVMMDDGVRTRDG